MAPVPVIGTGCFADVFRGAAEESRRLTEAPGASVVAEVDPVDGLHLDAAAHAASGRAVAGKLAEMLE